MNKALFLDRDGVINEEVHYLHKIEDFQFINGVFETCRFFIDQGFLIIIVTNQAGIARCYYSEEDYQQLTRWMLEQFENAGIRISSVLHCPHHPDFGQQCACRKPEPGMILAAKDEFQIDLNESILVGDKISDIQAGINAGIPTNILVTSGHAITEEASRIASDTIESIEFLPAWYRQQPG